MESEGLLGTDELKQQSLVQHEVLITFATTGKTPQDVKQAHMTGQFAAVGLTEAAAQFQEHAAAAHKLVAGQPTGRMLSGLESVDVSMSLRHTSLLPKRSWLAIAEL